MNRIFVQSRLIAVCTKNIEYPSAASEEKSLFLTQRREENP
jgi:hypothetical protein